MTKNSITLAEEYYTLVGQKNAAGLEAYLHPDVEFCSPLATLKGREAVIKATRHFIEAFRSLKIRAKFGNEGQAMVVYDTDIPEVAQDFPGASLLSFRDGEIVKIQLFYDGSRLMEKREEIFS
ncbi:MAG: hypothetical protein S4CHLAM123_00910 [Chlamydiales bacterium]|nr:hypothetical protein [Chlamydiales bacterium]